MLTLYSDTGSYPQAMRIGELARQAEVNIQTIRYYERRRLLRSPSRTPGGYRSYLPSDLEHLRFIKWCQRLGFTLREIRELLPLHASVSAWRPHVHRTELHSIAEMLGEKLANIDQRILALRQLRNELKKALLAIGGTNQPECPAGRMQNRGAGPDPRRRGNTQRA